VSLSEPNFEGLTLARLDSRGDDAEIRDQLRQQLRDGALDELRPPYEGADASGSVWVSVSDRAVVENVEVSQYWSDRLGAEDVARALFESYNDATRKAYTAAGLKAFERDEEGIDPAAGEPEPWYGPPPGIEDDERAWLRNVHATLEEIEIDMARRSRGDLDAGSRESTLSSPLGLFRVRFQGRAVIEITGDPRLIRGSGAEQLRREAIAVFRAAQGTSTDI
jgi:hypothetical protein